MVSHVGWNLSDANGLHGYVKPGMLAMSRYSNRPRSVGNGEGGQRKRDRCVTAS